MLTIEAFTAFEWFILFQHELLLFAGVFFLIGAADEICMDAAWIWFRLTGRTRTYVLPGTSDGTLPGTDQEPLIGPAAIFVPTWQESGVIGITIDHMLSSWRQSEFRVYVGCYANDQATIEAVRHAAAGDPRLRLVIHARIGPTTKADCLNRLYGALAEDELRSGIRTRMIVIHDAEDMVDHSALGLLDAAMDTSDLVQLPVLPVPQPQSRWIGSHYCEEFAEAHGKAMVVRDALRAGMPLAGVGCAVGRDALAVLARTKPGGNPFAADCLTEDYELGLGISAQSGTARFLRYRHADGQLVATRAYFPARLDQAVRQKTRWIHGIALQGWDRLGWHARPAEIWMRIRDRRGPVTALVLALAYALLVLATAGWLMNLAGVGQPLELSPELSIILVLNFVSFAWRVVWRFAFTAREYGWVEGLRAVLRIPVANIIAIMAGRRALIAYLKTLAGQIPQWDKTHHDAHPARIAAPSIAHSPLRKRPA
ncbi:glycosyl transferase family protein [Allopontixanthobacter sp.]|uniref:glycosyl transferase family protein n=1 Tax=Allopontixanthobacter sp. TaxID=2906452 RepID=UPI002ABBD9F4|nr:glycosyl transferase family protein [Allopontixanthobacter sp.]MDZ4306837.1 glycosyl transferase family protein [Allopontixanthobacter sp.]